MRILLDANMPSMGQRQMADIRPALGHSGTMCLIHLRTVDAALLPHCITGAPWHVYDLRAESVNRIPSPQWTAQFSTGGLVRDNDRRHLLWVVPKYWAAQWAWPLSRLVCYPCVTPQPPSDCSLVSGNECLNDDATPHFGCSPLPTTRCVAVALNVKVFTQTSDELPES